MPIFNFNKYDSDVRCRIYSKNMTILFEVHNNCTCTYCTAGWANKKFSLVLPIDKSNNSWRVIYWNWFGKKVYIRWTLPKFINKIINNK